MVVMNKVNFKKANFVNLGGWT